MSIFLNCKTINFYFSYFAFTSNPIKYEMSEPIIRKCESKLVLWKWKRNVFNKKDLSHKFSFKNITHVLSILL